MKLGKLASATVATAMIGGALMPAAADGEGEAKRFFESQYRHDVMEHFSYSFKKISMIMKGQAGSKDDIAAIANIMANASTMTKASFKKDTRNMEGHTEAKDNIWEKWDDFSQRLDKLEADANAFAVAANSGDMAQIGPAMENVGKNCKSCHDKYKKD